MKYATLLLSLILAIQFSAISFASSPMNPHTVSQRPFMEGWYTRITHGDLRVAVVVGVYHGKNFNDEGYVGVLTSKDGRLVVEEEFTSHFEIVSNGSSDLSPNFEVNLEDIARVKENYISVKLPSGTRLEATLSDRTPWKPISLGFGPESVGIHMPFKSHWYVHSLNSQADFTYDNPTLKISESGKGFAHQEKNWGRAFPSGWIWAQGGSTDGKYQFALAGGELDIAGLRAYLIGVKTPDGSFTFNPMHSFSRIKRLPCEGKINLTATGLSKRIVIEIKAETGSFSPLSVPTENGFIHGAIESFHAFANVKIFGGPLKKRLIHSFTIPKSALEFGGSYTCNN